MNRTIILIVTVILACGTTLKAQDTIVSKVPQKNYLVPYDWWGNADSLYDFSVFASWDVFEMARYCLAKDDSLLVYGIAAGMITRDYNRVALGYGDSINVDAPSYPVDTTHDLTESLRLYEYSSGRNTLYQIGEDLPVNALHTPVSYYQQFPQPLWVPFFDSIRNPPLPVYERYFSHPIVVKDSFYVGVTTNSWFKLASEGYRYHYWGFGAASLMSSSPDMTGGVLAVKDACRFMQGRDTVWNFSSSGASDCFLFPILTPNPDDTSHAAVEQADPASRLVAVAPNPASGQVKVACGAGMTLVEVFDNAGRKVHEQKATGMVVHFDVTGWPKGLYAVVVHSAVGSITKKLLVE